MPDRLDSGLDRAGCLRLLATQSLGRLIYTRRALPEVQPASYHLDRERVLIRLEAGSSAVKASQDAIVAFEADDFDMSSGSGWTVTVVGLAQMVPSQEWLRPATPGPSCATIDDDAHLLAVNVEWISGHRLIAAASGV